MIFLLYDDVPGVIGRVGTLLGEAKVNIANMAVSRNREGGKALMVALARHPRGVRGDRAATRGRRRRLSGYRVTTQFVKISASVTGAGARRRITTCEDAIRAPCRVRRGAGGVRSRCACASGAREPAWSRSTRARRSSTTRRPTLPGSSARTDSATRSASPRASTPGVAAPLTGTAAASSADKQRRRSKASTTPARMCRRRASTSPTW